MDSFSQPAPSSPSKTQKPWPPNILHGLFLALDECLQTGEYADKILERLFKAHRKWGSRDRRLVAQSFYEIVRWQRLLSVLCESQNPKFEADAVSLWAMFELYIQKADASRLRSTLSLEPVRERLSPELRHWIDQGAKLHKPKLKPDEELSYPTWLYDVFCKEVVAVDAHALMKALNQPAPVFLRVNTLKAPSKEAVIKQLAEEKILARSVEKRETSQGDPSSLDGCFPRDAIKLVERANVFVTKAFKNGFFEVQDLASQRVAEILNPKPGQKVADMCAGAGGKTLHLAALMQNKGRLLAFDVSERKLIELKLRARRAGVSNLSQHLILGTKDIKRHYDSCDHVLIDAPCSGSGVIRRNPDTKWKLTSERLSELREIQAQVLGDYGRLVKPGGQLMYVTCSVFKSENEDQVQRFLESHRDFEAQRQWKTTPFDYGEDGFFVQTFIKRPRT